MTDDPQTLRRLKTAWLVLLLAVAASRLLAIPSVPWEQDEALFAAASLDTNLIERRPHPPGFPLWIACGTTTQWLLGDPMVGLQLLSALASIASVWLLGRAWSHIIGATAGFAAATMYAFLPGVWFHAPRAFSTTPALACALAAVVCWQRRWLWCGTAAWVAAVLVRPPLAPPLIVLAVAAAALLRISWRRFALMGTAALGIVALGFVPLVVDTGGLGPFLQAATQHGSGHAGALHLAPWTIGSLGIVRALGGLLPAAVAVVLAALGTWGLWQRDRKVAMAWLVMLACTLAWILGAHNRTYPRYTLPALALLAGPVGLALELLWRRHARAVMATAGLAAVALGALTLPAVHTVATEEFPPLQAIAAATDPSPPGSVIVDGGLSPFGDLLGLAQRSDRPIVWRPLVAEGRIPLDLLEGPWTFVWSTGTPSRWIAAPERQPIAVSVGGAMLERLSQDRYLTTWRADVGAIVLQGPAVDARGHLPCTGTMRLLIQPTPKGSWLGLHTRVEGAPIELVARIEDRRLGSARLEPGRHPIFIDLPPAPSRAHHPSVVELAVTPSSPQAFCTVERTWVDAPNRPLAAYEISPEALPIARDGLIRAHGVHGVEQLSGRSGRWTEARAVLDLPVRAGTLSLELCAPRPGPVSAVLEADGLRRRLAIGGSWQTVRIPISAGTARIRLRLSTPEPLIPADTLPGTTDRRTLGIVLGTIAFEPRDPP